MEKQNRNPINWLRFTKLVSRYYGRHFLCARECERVCVSIDVRCVFGAFNLVVNACSFLPSMINLMFGYYLSIWNADMYSKNGFLWLL